MTFARHLVVKAPRPALVYVFSDDNRLAVLEPITLHLAFELVQSWKRVYPAATFNFIFAPRVQASPWPRPRFG